MNVLDVGLQGPQVYSGGRLKGSLCCADRCSTAAADGHDWCPRHLAELRGDRRPVPVIDPY